jgi:hypothetical protein
MPKKRRTSGSARRAHGQGRGHTAGQGQAVRSGAEDQVNVSQAPSTLVFIN